MLLNIIIVLIVVGVLLWLVNNYIPMDSKIKSILNAVVIIAVVIWLLQAFGVLGSLGSGWSWDWMGPAMTYTAASLCCLVGFVLVMWKLRAPVHAGRAG